MGFKLGKTFSGIAQNGKISSSLSFKSSEEEIPGTPIVSKDLGDSILGEANNDGSIYVSDRLEKGSPEYKETIIHEMKHMTDMRLGKLNYSDHEVLWDGQSYPRKDGYIYCDDQWKPEGSKEFPWEKMPWE
jgi:hypothetical protein